MERTLVIVQVGECRCPGTPHRDGDWVGLSPDMTVDLGSAVYAAIRAADGDDIRLQGLMAQAYLQFGIRAWSFVDEDGDPVRVDRTSKGWPDLIDKWLPWSSGGNIVTEKGDDLYSEEVLRPFRSRPSTQSLDGQTVGSISAIQPTGPKNPKPSKQSSQPSTDGTPSSG